jgi:hypothetical protein
MEMVRRVPQIGSWMGSMVLGPLFDRVLPPGLPPRKASVAPSTSSIDLCFPPLKMDSVIPAASAGGASEPQWESRIPSNQL